MQDLGVAHGQWTRPSRGKWILIPDEWYSFNRWLGSIHSCLPGWNSELIPTVIAMVVEWRGFIFKSRPPEDDVNDWFSVGGLMGSIIFGSRVALVIHLWVGGWYIFIFYSTSFESDYNLFCNLIDWKDKLCGNDIRHAFESIIIILRQPMNIFKWMLTADFLKLYVPLSHPKIKKMYAK